METESNLFIQFTLPSTMKRLVFDLLFCVVVIGLAMIIGLRATASGPGISPDSVSYISVGANIYHGNGFVADLTNAFDSGIRSPLTNWPPGYPLLIAGLMVFGLSALEAAKLVTIFCFALMLVVVYWLSQSLAGRLVGILCSVTVLVSMPVLQAATYALSEMPFILFTILAVAGFVQYAKTGPERRWYWLIFSAASTSLAILTRYNGLLWIPAGLLVIGLCLFKDRGKVSVASGIRQALLHAGVFTLISILPIFPWFIRNIIIVGNPTGFNRVNGIHPSLLENVRYAFATLIGELIPSIHIGLRSLLGQGKIVALLIVVLVLLIAGGIAVILARDSKKRAPVPGGKRALFATYQDFVVWLIPLLYSVLYLAGVLILASILQFPAYDWPRTLVVIYPLIFVILSYTWARMIRVILPSSSTLSRELSLALPALLLIVPYAVQSAGFVTQASKGQDLSAPIWHDNQGIRFLSAHVSQKDEIFSDKPDAVNFAMNRPVKYLPYPNEFNRFLGLLESSRSDTLYIIVFKGELGKPDPYLPGRLSSSDLEKLAAEDPNIKQVADFPDSTVYQVN